MALASLQTGTTSARITRSKAHDEGNQ